MGILIYTKLGIQRLLIAFVLLNLLLTGCSKELLDEGAESLGNKKVFLVKATIEPEQYNLSVSDTIWIKIPNTDTFYDAVSNTNITLNSPRFYCAIQVEDQIEPTMAVDFKVVVKSGELDKREGNAVGLTYGHPNQITELHVGIIFNEASRYAIWFNNYPNPYKSTGSEKGDISYFYDVNSDYSSDNGYSSNGFVDYLFDYQNFSIEDYNTAPYQKYAIYNNSVFVCSVRE